MFEEVEFCGTFRSYQQKILDGAKSYLDDGKINVVAAPGSGKTILGLELIRRLGAPCLIFSPTTTIRDQWGRRFYENFKGADKDFISYDLHAPKAITSVTYQALYSAMDGVKCEDGDEKDSSDVDIAEVIKSAGIGTVCLDEAHHLQNEWQRALEKFVAAFEGKVKIISLTATPPYDANAGEWKRYTDVCGEIDEEIFVPELVKQGTLCPHQDYIYFNFPTEREAREFDDYKRRVKEALDELGQSKLLKEACSALNMRAADLNGWLDGESAAVEACLRLFIQYKSEPDKRLCKFLGVKRTGGFGIKKAETSVNFIAFKDGLLSEEERAGVAEIFKRHSLFERGKIALDLNDKLKRRLISSVGKLDAVAKIAKFESKVMGEKLRLLALTDYIRRESAAGIGKEEKFDSLSVVSVFETIRKNCPYPCGAVSGSLVILPVKCAESMAYYGVKFGYKQIEGTSYAQFDIAGGNRDKVSVIGKLFESGEICALVGTKSLLGEGWDSPCINTLILASFVGSFMLSNQMRGRAIRTDKNNPDKTADIWHLVTVQPDGESDEINSFDFEVLERRFDCFVAPSYSFDRIENGIGRITVLQPPYDKNGIERINKKTLEIARDRDELKRRWASSLAISDKTFRLAEVPADRQMPRFTFYNISQIFLLCSLLSSVLGLLCYAFFTIAEVYVNVLLALVGAVAVFFLGDFLIGLLNVKFLKHSNPKKSIEHMCNCVLYTLKDMKKITSDCKTEVTSNDIGTIINVKLEGATVREQKLFTETVSDLFSPIENPRYVLIPRGMLGYDYNSALACPPIFGNNKENATLFADNLKKTAGRLKVVYARGKNAHKFLKKCRKRAYITRNSQNIEDCLVNY